MPFFKRAKPAGPAAKKPDQEVKPQLGGSTGPVEVPTTVADPSADAEGERNAMALARTRTEDIVYPTGLKLTLLMLSTFVSMFLVALVCNDCVYTHPYDILASRIGIGTSYRY